MSEALGTADVKPAFLLVAAIVCGRRRGEREAEARVSNIFVLAG